TLADRGGSSVFHIRGCFPTVSFGEHLNPARGVKNAAPASVSQRLPDRIDPRIYLDNLHVLQPRLVTILGSWSRASKLAFLQVFTETRSIKSGRNSHASLA